MILQLRCALIFLPFILLVSGCGLRNKPHQKLIPFSQTQENVQLLIKPIDKYESRKKFGRNALKRGYQPLSITIENDSDTYYILHPWYIGLPIESPKKVAKAMYHPITLAAVSMIAIGALGIQWFTPLAICISGSIPVCIYLEYLNKNIKRAVMKDSIDRGVESIVIPPFGNLTRNIFVRHADFEPHFMFTVFNSKDNKPLKFDVSLIKPNIIV